jgi:hypothetical protein
LGLAPKPPRLEPSSTVTFGLGAPGTLASSVQIDEKRNHMATNEKVREEHGAADERAQRKLTTSVGTPLEPSKKPSRRKLFGRRSERPAAGS